MSTRAQHAAADFARAKAEQPLEVGELLRGAERVRAKFARLIKASADEIGLLFSTAEGENVIAAGLDLRPRSEEHTSELQSLMRNSYAGLGLKKKNTYKQTHV